MPLTLAAGVIAQLSVSSMPTDGASGGYTPVEAGLAAEVLANPAGFYVNVHTQEVPTGAIRGQLKR